MKCTDAMTRCQQRVRCFRPPLGAARRRSRVHARSPRPKTSAITKPKFMRIRAQNRTFRASRHLRDRALGGGVERSTPSLSFFFELGVLRTTTRHDRGRHWGDTTRSGSPDERPKTPPRWAPCPVQVTDPRWDRRPPLIRVLIENLGRFLRSCCAQKWGRDRDR